MKVTIETALTPDYVMAHAHSGYWYRDGALSEHERAAWPGAWPKLTKARLAAGFRLLPTINNVELIGRIVRGEPDGEDLDVLLQLALFGKVVYG